MYDEKCLQRIGSNIRFLRNACHISQLDLAKQIGISQTHMSNLEHSRVQVSLKLLLRIANILGCQLESLLDIQAAVEWVETKDQKGAEKQSCYSLEEVHLLLKMLQL